MNRTSITEALKSYRAEKLDGSARGSGFNAVWKIEIDGRPAIVKTFSSRRGWLQTGLSNLNHCLSGRTPYTAQGRCRTESELLTLWKQAGLDVPALIACPRGQRIPLPHLCMEYVDGRIMSDYLADPGVSQKDKDAVFVRFARMWGQRHALAERESDPRFLQEHGTFDHVLVSGARLVTFDLEVAFRRRSRVLRCTAQEMGGYLRSLFRKQSRDLGARLLTLLVQEYPHPAYLRAAHEELFRSRHMPTRMLNSLDRRFLRRRGEMNKFEAISRLKQALDDAPSSA